MTHVKRLKRKKLMALFMGKQINGKKHYDIQQQATTTELLTWDKHIENLEG